MSKYTHEDVTSFFEQPLTPRQVNGVLAYLNEGKIPPADPCLSCEPNTIRKLISAVQSEERRAGAFPRVQAAPVPEVPQADSDAAEAISEDVAPKPKPRARKGK